MGLKLREVLLERRWPWAKAEKGPISRVFCERSLYGEKATEHTGKKCKFTNRKCAYTLTRGCSCFLPILVYNELMGPPKKQAVSRKR